MSQLVARTVVPHPVDDVFGWHERPGAFVRLTPPGFGRVVAEGADLRPGATARLRINIPGTRVPFLQPMSVPWLAEHRSYQPPHGFGDIMASGPMAAWRHDREFAAHPDGTELTDRVTYRLPAGARLPGVSTLVRERLEKFFAYRGRALVTDLAFHATYSTTPRSILIAGATGLIGTQLTAFLRGGGHRVRRLVRRAPEPGSGDVGWDPAGAGLDPAALADTDVVINLAGSPIAGRFTDQHLRRVRQSRVDGTTALARALAAAADDRPRALINASASGYYGARRGDEQLTENAVVGHDEMAGIVHAWEESTQPARDAGVRVAVLRTGIVQSPAGGQLPAQLPLFLWGVGGPLGNGRQWVPWVAIDDVVRAYAFLALTDAAGPHNCAPAPVTGDEYADTLAEVVHRPAVVRVPRLGPAVLLGGRGADQFALAGQRMLPEQLTTAGFEFAYPDLHAGLAHVLAADTSGPTQFDAA